MAWDSTLLSMFDEYRNLDNLTLQNDCTSEFIIFLKNQEENKLKWRESVFECKRLKAELDNSNSKISELEKKLNRARVLLDSERKHTLQAESERDELRDQVAQIEDILSCVKKAGDKLANETKEKLDKFLSTTHSKLRPSNDYVKYRLDTIDEINSTARIRMQNFNSSSSSARSSYWSVHSGSLLSDISYTRSEDNIDINTSLSERGVFKKPKRSLSPRQNDIIFKKRSSRTTERAKKILKTSADHLVATTTVTLPKVGPVLACSKIETFPESNQNFFEPSAPLKSSSETDSDVAEAVKQFPQTPGTNLYTSNKLFTRSHCFRNKTLLKPSEECGVCFKKIAFSNKIFYCPDCKVVAHPECRDKVPLPCITVVETPRGASYTTISDFCSKSSPMIPPLIVHCVIEIEARGLNEVGIYRIPGSERDVKALKDRFLRGKGICSLSSYDIHVVCGTIKDFLKSFKEPLVTYLLWPEFVRAIEFKDSSDKICALYQTIAQLPQPNRDTLAFLMQHLQRVAQSPDCKMSKTNLANIFGPIIGYSSPEFGRNDMYMERNQQTQIIESFLDMPSEYWHGFVYNDVHLGTPIASAALNKKTRGRNRKLFSTPPVK